MRRHDRSAWLSSLALALAIGLIDPCSADPTWEEFRALDDWVEHSTREHEEAGPVKVSRTGRACLVVRGMLVSEQS